MKLNHINLPVKDVTAAREFFETYFNFRSEDIKLNDTLSVLKGEDGFTLVLMSEKLNQNGNHAYPDAFHIGFFQSTEAEVTAIFERLKVGGIYLEKEPQLIRKTFGFYFRFQDILIEIATGG
ncbi:VOC family protein [Mucilaginibacter corticis]|uniref:VOC family protein n=1 Tax=Mucilaginibacter corticis TaxID=2597670 RepID=A0A556MLR8_9SPHI|nr:VOC family protein [Mucilaginibacter corticis]TSJ40788.1 VOC family protein [Mucilaginibacter corticis]